jgi:hypothetical protein
VIRSGNSGAGPATSRRRSLAGSTHTGCSKDCTGSTRNRARYRPLRLRARCPPRHRGQPHVPGAAVITTTPRIAAPAARVRPVRVKRSPRVILASCSSTRAEESLISDTRYIRDKQISGEASSKPNFEQRFTPDHAPISALGLCRVGAQDYRLSCATSILMTLALRGHKSQSSLHTAPASRSFSNRLCRL